MKKRTRPPKERRDRYAYRQLWRVVDGAIADAMARHPEYFRAQDKMTIRNSLNKRVVGAILGYAEQSAKGRSGESPAADKAGLTVDGSAAGDLTPRLRRGSGHNTSRAARPARARRGRSAKIDPAILAAILKEDARLREIARERGA